MGKELLIRVERERQMPDHTRPEDSIKGFNLKQWRIIEKF
jgi:hypothetical protein